MTSKRRTRKHIDPDALDAAIKKREEWRIRRREQWRQASIRKRAKKKQALSLSTRAPRTILENLSSGDFPATKPIEAMCKLGLTDAEIAGILGVGKSTFARWKKMSPKLRAAITRGRTIADTHVAESLYMQAIGHTVPEEKIFYDSKRGKVVRAETSHYYPPNVVAAIFWLKNRYNDYWRDRKSEDQGPTTPTSVNQVKFVIVQSAGGQSAKDKEKLIDGDYKIIAPPPATANSVKTNDQTV